MAKRFIKALEREEYDGGTRVMIHMRAMAEPQADFARQCIERWGLIAGTPDGEDSAGRAKLRLATSEELVSRACEVAEKLFAEFERREWLTDIVEPKAAPARAKT